MDDKKIPDHFVKVVVVGDGAVGKTCLLQVFKSGNIPDGLFDVYTPTIFENHEFDMSEKDKDGKERIKIDGLEGKKVIAQLWDTAGQEGFDQIRVLGYENTNCFIVCFSCDDYLTFKNVDGDSSIEGQKWNGWLQEIREHKPEAKILLVGTKSDLRKSGSGDNVPDPTNKRKTTLASSLRKREVPTKHIKELQKKAKLAAYVECSAKTDLSSVNKVFETAITLGLQQMKVIAEPEPEPDADCWVYRCCCKLQ